MWRDIADQPIDAGERAHFEGRELIEFGAVDQDSEGFGLLNHGARNLRLLDIEIHRAGADIQCANCQRCVMRAKRPDLGRNQCSDGLAVVAAELSAQQKGSIVAVR